MVSASRRDRNAFSSEARLFFVDPLKEDLNLELGKSGKEKNNPEFIFNTAFRISFFILFVPEFQIEGPSLRG
jgi:hypothetical protein